MLNRTILIKILAFFVMLVFSGCSDVGTTFTDNTGIEWRILTIDKNGNKLIITESAFGPVQYNSTNVYTRLGDSDVLRPALNEWFVYELASELKERALPAMNLDNDVRLSPSSNVDERLRENSSEGLTYAGEGEATAENSLFVLSLSEVNQYNRAGEFLGGMMGFFGRNERLGVGWLRSPGVSYKSPNLQTLVGEHHDTDGPLITPATADYYGYFRPALWVSPDS
ncbi:MAG: hypothetical protein FWF76_06840 [Oscillospiraceae bacterium]|nr:hypothetical protein [Oscillospiraceae bacterium]